MIATLIAVIAASPILTLESNNLAVGVATPIAYKRCLVTGVGVTENLSCNGVDIPSENVFSSQKYPLKYILNHGLEQVDYIEVSIGNTFNAGSVSVGTLGSDHSNLATAKVIDWAAPFTINGTLVTGYKIETVPPATVIGSPVLEQNSNKLVGVIVNAKEGWVLPSLHLIQDINASTPNIEIEDSNDTFIRNGELKVKAVKKWTLGTPNIPHGDIIRSYREINSTFGFKSPQKVKLFGHKNLIVASRIDNTLVGFDTDQEKTLWSHHLRRYLYHQSTQSISDDILVIAACRMGTDTEYAGPFMRNHILDNLSSFDITQSPTGHIISAEPCSFPGSLVTSRQGFVYGGLGEYVWSSNRHTAINTTRFPENKVDRRSWCIPISYDASRVVGIEVPCRLAGRGTNREPYIFRVDGDLELVTRNLSSGKVIEKKKLADKNDNVLPIGSGGESIGSRKGYIVYGDKVLLIDDTKGIYNSIPCHGARLVRKTESLLCVLEGNRLTTYNLPQGSERFYLSGWSDLYGMTESTDGLLYLTSTSGKVECIDVSDGTRVFTTTLPDLGSSVPLILGNDLWLLNEKMQLFRLENVHKLALDSLKE